MMTEINKEKNYILGLIEMILFDETNIDPTNDEIKRKLSDTSELKMHKILYFLYGLYYVKFRKELFDAKFQAGKYGPVEVNYRYNSQEQFEIQYEKNEINFLKDTIKYLMTLNTGELVEGSHSTTPGIEAKSKNEFYTPIENKKIQDYFVKTYDN